MAALKTVFTSSVGNAKLEYGFETTYTHFHQKYNVENNNYTGVLTANDNSSEQKAANVFANYSRSFGKLYTQLGVKYEYADYDYFDNGKLLSSSSRTYHRILPSVYFSYPINRLSLMLSYNIYAQCPSYSQLDEGMQYISDFRYNKGIHCCVPLTNTKYHLMHRMEISNSSPIIPTRKMPSSHGSR